LRWGLDHPSATRNRDHAVAHGTDGFDVPGVRLHLFCVVADGQHALLPPFVIATTDGSLSTTPRPLMQMSVAESPDRSSLTTF
jgi:hypothetical protein